MGGDKRAGKRSHMIPYVSIPPIMVTKDNIDSVIIDSGFHLREDVYLKERQD